MDSFADRRQKYVSGLIIRALVCSIFSAVFATNAYFESDSTRPHFLLAVALLVVLGVANVPFWIVGKAYRFPLGQFYVHWAVDLLGVTWLLHLLGGVELPYGPVGYMIMILTSAVFLSNTASFIVATGSTLCFDSLIIAEQIGWLDTYPELWRHEYAFNVRVFIVIACNVFFYLFAFLAGSLAEQLKAATVALRHTRDELEVYNRTLEERVVERTAALEQKNKEIEEFIHIVTHDLRNVSVGASELARRLLATEGDVLSKRGRRYADSLLEDTRSMNNMLSGLLALLRVDYESQNRQVVRASSIARDIIEANSVRLEAKQIKATIEELPDVEVNANQLRHVLANLIHNAIKYSGDKSDNWIKIRCLDQGDALCFVVEDSGIGIPPDQRERIFDLYHRGPYQTVGGDSQEGHGVGLAMAKRMVDRWGGRIWVTSELGVRSSFYFTCPKHPRPAAGVVPAKEA